jgi:phosphoribosylaminoimidazole-succinocarboxamide synthase
MPAAAALMSTDLPLPKRSGKVRDVYDLEALLPGHLLIVATDRISAYDVIMPDGVPGKGILLTHTTLFWFEKYRAQFPNHVVTADVARYPQSLRRHEDQLRGRSMLVRKGAVIPFECVARGYLAGSGWREYATTGQVCGIRLPPGLQNGSRLPAPIFTPATKAQSGHDENIPFEDMAGELGLDLAEELRERTLRLYAMAAEFALSRGIILADTKFEWGHDAEGNLMLVDEILTPDSSRFWPADAWQPGREQASFDKQFVRDYLGTLEWDRTPPGPPLPPEVIRGTQRRYLDAYQRLTGKKLDLGSYSVA